MVEEGVAFEPLPCEARGLDGLELPMTVPFTGEEKALNVYPEAQKNDLCLVLEILLERVKRWMEGR